MLRLRQTITRLVLAVTAGCALLCAPAQSAEICPGPTAREAAEPGADWSARSVRLAVLEQPLSATLHDLGTLTGFSMSVGTRVSGVLRRTRIDGPLREVLGGLASSHGLVWFGDGRQVAVVASDESVQRFLTVPGVRESQICTALQRFRVVGDGLELAIDERSGVVRVAGPPAFVTLVETLAGGDGPRVMPSEGITVIKFGVKTSN